MFKCKTENCGPAGKILEGKKSTPLTIKMLHKSLWLWYKAITTGYFLIFVLFWLKGQCKLLNYMVKSYDWTPVK